MVQNCLRSCACIIALTVALAGQECSAALLLPNITIFAPSEPDPLGAVLATATVPVNAATFTGSLTSSVVMDLTNPLGGLTFTYRLFNAASSAHAIGRLTVNSYAGSLTDASFAAIPASTPPAFIDRSSGAGDVVGFTFFSLPFGPGKLLPGHSSALLVVQTNAPSYQHTTASVINGSTAAADTFAPAVPEPSTMAMWLGIGLFALLGRFAGPLPDAIAKLARAH